jgi:hypothetical protein
VTPSAASTSAGPRKLTKFDAETLAREINLAQSDFPSYTVSPNTESKSDRQDDDRIARCAGGVPESAYKFDASSPDIDKGAIDLSSEISVLPSAAAARRDTRAESSPVALRCAGTISARRSRASRSLASPKPSGLSREFPVLAS